MNAEQLEIMAIDGFGQGKLLPNNPWRSTLWKVWKGPPSLMLSFVIECRRGGAAYPPVRSAALSLMALLNKELLDQKQMKGQVKDWPAGM